MSTPHDTPCSNCDRKGLPILFTRYAAAWHSDPACMAALQALQPGGSFSPRPGGVDMGAARYNLRLLRPGCLYVRFVHPCYLAPVWRGYAVHPHGYLAQFPVTDPQQARAHPSCEMEIRGANMSMVWVDDAANVSELHYLFSPDPIDPLHLKEVVEPRRDTLMRRFDVAAWAQGATGMEHSGTPGQLDAQVVEFAAVGNAALRDAMEPQLYGLMGAHPIERGWGDHEISTPIYEGISRGATQPRTVLHGTRKGPDYADAHGKRLAKMAEYLGKYKGAVLACDDAIGIAQELGHLQAEAQTHYTKWQIARARAHSPNVTNEWVLQTALAGLGLQQMAEQGMVLREQDRLDNAAPIFASDWQTFARHEHYDLMRMQMRQANRDKALEQTRAKVRASFARVFDEAGARDILKDSEIVRANTQEHIDALGADQAAWLRALNRGTALDCYSQRDERIARPGGGAALSLQLAQCLAGCETNGPGRALLEAFDPVGQNLLARMLCFNNATLHGVAQTAAQAAANQAAANPTALPPRDAKAPDAEPEPAVANGAATALKLTAGRLALGDKALAFIEAAQQPDAPALLRKGAWAGQVGSLLSARAMTGVNKLPRSAMEARMVRHLTLAAMSTLGETAHKEIEALRVDVEAEAKRIALRARKLERLAQPETRAGRADALKRARSAAPGTRAAMAGAMLDLFGAVIKGNQFGTKLDARSAFDLTGQMLQGLGSLYDWRAKVYEETVFKGVRGTDVYKYKALQQGLDEINATHLRSLRLTAFKFLGPAAMFSVTLDSVDAWKSFKRNDGALMAAQIASIFGTIFTVTSTGLGVAALTASSVSLGTTLAAIGVVLGLVGAVVTIGATIAIIVLSDEKWEDWLKDCPLNKLRRGQTPIHADLAETMQEFANAQAELAAA